MVQSDSEANCNLTNDLDLLTDVHDTPDNILATCNTNDASNIVSNKAGYIIFRDDTGHVIRTKVYYSTDSDGTVLSPTSITKQNKTKIGLMAGYNTQIMTQKLVKLYLLADLATLILPFALLVLMISGTMTLTSLL